MPLTKGQRKKLHQKFASLIGGTDVDGNEHKLAPSEKEREIKRARELFVVRDFEKDNSIWEFVDGRRVLEFIMAGRYDIEYLGKNKDALGNKKVRTKMTEQVKQIVAGKRAKDEKAGTFEADEHYEALLKKMLKELEDRFTEYDKKKQEQLE
jgi:hypothetical protein